MILFILLVMLIFILIILNRLSFSLSREPYKLPEIVINPEVTDILKFRFDDFTLTDYVAHPHIKGDIAV